MATTTKKQRNKAFKESLADTILALIINFPLNIFLVAIAFELQLGILATSIFLTSVFFIVAVIRKTYTRLYFDKKNAKKGWNLSKKHYISIVKR